MNALRKWIQRYAKQIGLAITLGGAAVQPALAQDEDALLTQLNATSSGQSSVLQQIKANTDAILAGVQALPGILNQLFSAYLADPLSMADSFISTKDSNNIIGINVPSFTQVFNDYNNTINQQQTLSQQLTKLYLAGPQNSPLPTTANELNYTILLGQFLTTPDPNNPPNVNTLSQNYIGHVSGMDFAISPPSPGWRPSGPKTQYTALFNTTAAIASYNAYIISGLNQQQNPDQNRLTLLKQATDPKLFLSDGGIGTEDLGLVMRQMLMYTSQLYVAVDRLLKVQQQQLAAQAMTNALLIGYASTSIATSLATQAATAR